MKLHFRFDENNTEHTKATIFIDGKNCGQIVSGPAEMIWFHHILHAGCDKLSPNGVKPIEFLSSGQPPKPEPVEIDKVVS